MTLAQFVQAPLKGNVSVSRVFWLYGVVGSLVYGLLEFFINPANAFLIRLYTVGAYAYSAYVIVGTRVVNVVEMKYFWVSARAKFHRALSVTEGTARRG